MKIKIMWINRNNPNIYGEGEYTEWSSVEEVEVYLKKLNKQHPYLDHSYKIEETGNK